MFPMNPLTDPRSSRHRTRMQLFGITRWSCSFPDDKVGCSGEFEAGRMTFADGVQYSRPVYLSAFPTRRRAKGPQQRTDSLSKPYVPPGDGSTTRSCT